jgi:hypothetical protein
MTTINREIVEYDAVSIRSYAQSLIGGAASEWSITFLGATAGAGRTISALPHANPDAAYLTLAALCYDLQMKGII